MNEKLEEYKTAIEFNSLMIKDSEQNRINLKKVIKCGKRIDDKIKELDIKCFLLEKRNMM